MAIAIAIAMSLATAMTIACVAVLGIVDEIHCCLVCLGRRVFLIETY